MNVDVVIVGAGPAGLAAAIAGQTNRSTGLEPLELCFAGHVEKQNRFETARGVDLHRIGGAAEVITVEGEQPA